MIENLHIKVLFTFVTVNLFTSFKQIKRTISSSVYLFKQCWNNLIEGVKFSGIPVCAARKLNGNGKFEIACNAPIFRGRYCLYHSRQLPIECEAYHIIGSNVIGNREEAREEKRLRERFADQFNIPMDAAHFNRIRFLEKIIECGVKIEPTFREKFVTKSRNNPVCEYQFREKMNRLMLLPGKIRLDNQWTSAEDLDHVNIRDEWEHPIREYTRDENGIEKILLHLFSYFPQSSKEEIAYLDLPEAVHRRYAVNEDW